MAGTRTKLIALAAVVAVGGAAAYALTSGDNPIIEIATSKNVIKLEAAGIQYTGWPEMAVSVNGEQIAVLTVDNSVRSEFTFNVPSSVGEVSTIEVRMTSDTNCREALFLEVHTCTNRTLILRKLWLNDKPITDPVATGEGNFPWSVVSSNGAVTWTVGG
jgi:hypothetical protein